MHNNALVKPIVLRNKDVIPTVTLGELSDDDKTRVLALAEDVMTERCQPGKRISGARDVADYLMLTLRDCRNEVFGCMWLTSKNSVIAIEHLFEGTVDQARVYPRRVVQAAIAHNAPAVIFYHNHPSGVSELSYSDKTITEKLKQALSLIDVRVLDHIVIGGNQFTSFVEEGLL